MRGGHEIGSGHAPALSNTSRQYGPTIADIRRDHVARYEFAARYTSGRVLDAACGCGYGSTILHNYGAIRQVVGVDASQEAIDYANENYPGPTYILGKIEEAPWEGTFRTIVSLETIEHMEYHDATRALRAFKAALWPHGIVIVSVPNELRYPFNADKFKGDEYPHRRHYTPEQLDELLEGAGFYVTGRHCQHSKSDPGVVAGTEGDFLIYTVESV